MVGLDHVRDLGRETVIIANSDFLGRDRVILVHHRHHAMFEQALDRVADIEEAAALLDIAERHQDLPDNEAMLGGNLAVGVQQEWLTAGGGGLLVEHVGIFRGFVDGIEAERDGAGGSQDHSEARA